MSDTASTKLTFCVGWENMLFRKTNEAITHTINNTNKELDVLLWGCQVLRVLIVAQNDKFLLRISFKKLEHSRKKCSL